MTLLETLRSQSTDTEPEAWIFGFDPDLNHSGYCAYHFNYNGVGRISPIAVHMGTIVPKPGTKRMDKAVGMSRAIYELPIQHPLRCSYYALIEGQEIYHNAKDPLKTTVAKANDLLLLAYISGAMVFKLQSLALTTSIKLLKPKEWKANAKKEAMHAVFLRHLEKTSAEVFMEGDKWNRKPPNIHTLDACCMCLKAANKIAKGTWK